MASDKSKYPDFFEDHFTDPVTAAMGKSAETPAVPKRKAGFYLSEATLDRFNRKFHELKLSGADIDNKSALVEMAITFALDDLDIGEKSRLLKKMQPR